MFDYYQLQQRGLSIAINDINGFPVFEKGLTLLDS